MKDQSERKKRILVIDDEKLVTKTFTLLLQKNGYDVCVAENGNDAVVAARKERFDLVICDIRMPGLNGVDTIKAIQSSRNGSQCSNIPIVFITGFADPEIESNASELKPLAYLHKPFDNSELLEIVKSSLSSVCTF